MICCLIGAIISMIPVNLAHLYEHLLQIILCLIFFVASLFLIEEGKLDDDDAFYE